MTLGDWGTIATIVAVGAVFAGMVRAGLNRIHARIDDHMKDERVDASSQNAALGALREDIADVRSDVAFLAGGLGVNLPRRQ